MCVTLFDWVQSKVVQKRHGEAFYFDGEMIFTKIIAKMHTNIKQKYKMINLRK